MKFRQKESSKIATATQNRTDVAAPASVADDSIPEGRTPVRMPGNIPIGSKSARETRGAARHRARCRMIAFLLSSFPGRFHRYATAAPARRMTAGMAVRLYLVSADTARYMQCSPTTAEEARVRKAAVPLYRILESARRNTTHEKARSRRNWWKTSSAVGLSAATVYPASFDAADERLTGFSSGREMQPRGV